MAALEMAGFRYKAPSKIIQSYATGVPLPSCWFIKPQEVLGGELPTNRGCGL